VSRVDDRRGHLILDRQNATAALAVGLAAATFGANALWDSSVGSTVVSMLPVDTVAASR
jgi:Na+/glutamate symporter